MATEWHRVAFLSPGRRRVDDGGNEHEYHPQEIVGYGFYEIVDGVVTRHLDESGIELDMERLHECRVVARLKSSPFASS